MIIWHKHHIVPRHAGGSDDPSNIVKVNLAMHAFLHRQLYKENGDLRDKVAADMLAGQTTPHEARLLASRIGREKKSPYKSHANSVIYPKKYVLYSPNGERVSLENLTRFCKENRLQLWNIHAVLKGKRKHHKGWSAAPKSSLQKKGYFKEAYVLLSPSNEITICYSQSEFAKEHSLSQGNLGSVIRGKRNHTKGWRCGLAALDEYNRKIGE